MKIILLSGGSGTRLWPLSNDARSKQFLKVLCNYENTQESMVQRVWNQISSVGLGESTIIATSMSQVDMLKNQLNEEVEIVVEPTRRDTFPAIALAATYLYSVKGAPLDEVISILPVDPYVDKEFFEKIKDLENIINVSKADIALIGVKPTIPSSKYGYIVPTNTNFKGNFQEVSEFTEKPTEEKARKLIKQGALWNCGVFSFKLGYILDILSAQSLPIDYHELRKNYDSMRKISFDYEVVEKSKKIVVSPYEGYWKDLGTWNTLTEEMNTRQLGKGIISEDCENTHLVNELDIPVAVMGVSDIVVAASPDGILVSSKNASPNIKNIVSEFRNMPMYVERKWGWYKVLDHTLMGDELEVLTKKIGIDSGKNLSYQYHNSRKEVWTILSGKGILALNGQLRNVKQGDVIEIKKRDLHAIKAITNIEMIEVQCGNQLTESDIYREYENWSEIEINCYELSN